MPTSFLSAIHFPPEVDKPEAAKRLGGCLQILKSHGLEPFPFAEPAWTSATPAIFGGSTLIHREFSTLTSDPLWGAGFMIVPAPRAEANIVTMTTPATPLGNDRDAWTWLVKLAEELCDNVGADMGLINGFTVDSKGRAVGSTPAGPDVAPGHPPEVLCPWMYWSATRLRADGIADSLKNITAAARSSQTQKGGWVLQAYENYSGTAPKKLLRECSAAWQVQRLEWMGVP